MGTKNVRARGIALVAAAVLAAAASAGCTKTDTTASGELLQSLKDKGTITVGFAGEAPYSFEDNGQLTGATVALHREIFRNLGIDTVEGCRPISAR